MAKRVNKLDNARITFRLPSADKQHMEAIAKEMYHGDNKVGDFIKLVLFREMRNYRQNGTPK